MFLLLITKQISYCNNCHLFLGRKVLKIKDLAFEVVDAGEFLRLAMLLDMVQKYNNSDCGKAFVAVLDGYAKEVAA